MYIFFEVIRGIVVVALTIVQFAMLVRAVMSWFMAEGRFVNFLYAVTEPFIQPIRAFMVKMNWLQGSPIDFSFMITYLLISIITVFLS